jgi:uncharacterized membrane protein
MYSIYLFGEEVVGAVCLRAQQLKGSKVSKLLENATHISETAFSRLRVTGIVTYICTYNTI